MSKEKMYRLFPLSTQTRVKPEVCLKKGITFHSFVYLCGNIWYDFHECRTYDYGKRLGNGRNNFTHVHVPLKRNLGP